MQRRTAAMVVLIVAGFMDLMDTTVVNVALPSMARDLPATAAQLQWIVGAYTLGLVGALVLGGRAGDLLGRRTVFLIGVVGFTLASLLAAVAPDAALLIAARAVQGVFAGAMVPQVLANVQVLYAPEERPAVFGLVGFITGTASVVGPVLSGWLVSSDAFGIGWRSVFAINVPVGVLLVVAAVLVVPNSRSEHPARLDIVGAVLITAAVLCLVLPLIDGRQEGWPLWSWLVLAASPVLLVGFALWELRQERRVDDRGTVPLIPPHLFRDRSYVAGSVVNLAFQAGLVGFFLFFTIYLQSALGYSAMQSGLSWLGFSLGTLTGSLAAVRFVAQHGRALITIGALITAAGVTWLVLVAAVPSTAGGSPNGWDFVGGLVLAGLGMGLLIVPLFDVTLHAVPVADAGAASGALSTIQQIGGALGVAVIGAVFYAVAGAHPDPASLTAALHAAAWGCVVAFVLAAVASVLLKRSSSVRDVEGLVEAVRP